MTDKHTSGPWKVGEFDEHLGYDCMTAGVRSGPIVLDGADYGQKSCQSMPADAKERMLADARLIAAAPDLLVALETLLKEIDFFKISNTNELDSAANVIESARAALSRARGE